MSHWNRHDVLMAAPAFITAVVAVIVAYIAYQQWRTARDKLRLDLYNRRFEIYTKVFDFCTALLKWHETPRVDLQDSFLKAFRESRFLFPKSSGVYSFLEEIYRNAQPITKFEHLKSIGVMPEELMERKLEMRSQYEEWIANALIPLEDKMAPYLDFHKL